MGWEHGLLSPAAALISTANLAVAGKHDRGSLNEISAGGGVDPGRRPTGTTTLLSAHKVVRGPFLPSFADRGDNREGGVEPRLRIP